MQLLNNHTQAEPYMIDNRIYADINEFKKDYEEKLNSGDYALGVFPYCSIGDSYCNVRTGDGGGTFGTASAGIPGCISDKCSANSACCA